MRWSVLRNAFALSVLLVTFRVGPSLAGSCPSVCACKWKGGKQTVECLERALITIPDNIDSETQVVDMSGNNLQILPRETFYKANLTNLQKVFLRSCRIGQIGDRAFRGLTNLVELDLSHNLLTGVPSATFEDTPFLRYLSLANNPIQKIESNAFRMATGMAKIDLSHCEIQVISPNAFDKLESLEWLKLNGNKLTELHPRTVDTISKLHGVELHDNPWLCDCKLRPTKEWLSHNNIPYPVAPVCRGPDRVAGRSFADLHVDDFACRPEILPVSRYLEATTGENASVLCRVGAVPSPNIHWYWNGRLLLNNSAFSAYQKLFILEDGHFEKSSTLILTNALETDSGEFYCVAENRAGTAEANFTLHVSLRTAGMASLGSGQIAGLSAALVILILAILMIALLLLLRLRRLPFSDSKTPGQLQVIATMNGNGVTTTTKTAQRILIDPGDRKDSHPTNPLQKPPRTNDSHPSSLAPPNNHPTLTSHKPSGNNPDIIRDAKPDPSALTPAPAPAPAPAPVPPFAPTPTHVPPPYSSNPQHPSSPWHYHTHSPSHSHSPSPSTSPQTDPYITLPIDSSDKTPIITQQDDDCRFSRGNPHHFPSDFPPDYGLPIPPHLQSTFPLPDPSSSQLPNPNTLRVRQRGIPVLPPATALKRVLAHSRNSPDEGYQEGCGTDV